MNAKIHYSGPSVTQDLLGDLERKIGVVLPPDYKEFLLQHNGGIPDPACFRFISEKGTEIHSELSFILGIFPDDDIADLFSYRVMQLDLLPVEFLVVASDEAGNEICLGISGKYYGKIYWYWEKGKEQTKPSFKFVEQIAGSFSAWIDSLGSCPEG